MPVPTATLPQLVHQFREKFEGANVARCCVLIGAGCSFNSKIPLGGGIVELLRMETFRQLHVVEPTKWPLEKASDYRDQFYTYLDAKNLRQAFNDFNMAGQAELQQQIDGLNADIKRSKLPLEIQKKEPKEQDDYFKEKKAEFYQDAQYEYWFSRYSENASDRQRFVERVIDGKDTGYGYVTLASLMAEGYVRNVFTTNFDDLLHDALMLFFNERVKVYAHSDLSDFLNLRDKKPNIIKLHGDFRYQDIRNTSFEIDETRNRLSEKLGDALSETPCFNLVVIGYGGADVSILNQLQAAKLRNPQSPFRLIWTDLKPFDQLHWRVRHLLETTRNNFFLQIESFDLLMLELHQALQLKPVQIEEKAKERQREIDSYFGKMKTEVDNAAITPEEKDLLQNHLQANKLFNQAYESENVEEQCQLYEQVIQLKPDFAEALNNWGSALASLGHFEEAIQKYKQALLIKPDFAEALNNWGSALASLGHFEEAIQMYEQALQIKPDYAKSLNNWGNTFAKLERFEEAIQKYKQALLIKPDFAEALNNWGSALASLGHFEEAIQMYEQALQIKPDYAEALYNWGNTLAKLGLFNDACQKYNQALQLKPDSYTSIFNMACAYAMMLNIPEVARLLDKWRKVDPKASIEKINNDPDFDGIREDPAFQRYLETWQSES